MTYQVIIIITIVTIAYIESTDIKKHKFKQPREQSGSQ